jgi:hypothetical protein
VVLFQLTASKSLWGGLLKGAGAGAAVSFAATETARLPGAEELAVYLMVGIASFVVVIVAGRRVVRPVRRRSRRVRRLPSGSLSVLAGRRAGVLGRSSRSPSTVTAADGPVREPLLRAVID